MIDCYDTKEPISVIASGADGETYKLCDRLDPRGDPSCEKYVSKRIIDDGAFGSKTASFFVELEANKVLNLVDPEGEFHPRLIHAYRCNNGYNILFENGGDITVGKDLMNQAEGKPGFVHSNHIQDFILKFLTLEAKFADFAIKSGRYNKRGELMVLVHGDLHWGNMLFNKTKNQIVPIDWGRSKFTWVTQEIIETPDGYYAKIYKAISSTPGYVHVPPYKYYWEYDFIRLHFLLCTMIKEFGINSPGVANLINTPISFDGEVLTLPRHIERERMAFGSFMRQHPRPQQ